MPSLAVFLRALCVSVLLTATAHAFTVERLQVESLDRPLGIDTPHPRLSWQLRSEERAQNQHAYQILVASTEEVLSANRGDLWDSGKVVSSENFGIDYAGPALRSNQRYHWKVRTWDRHDRPSDWSAAAWWHTGLLAASDWKAKWINTGGVAHSPLLRREFKTGSRIVQATAFAYATGWYRLFLNGTELTERVLTPINSNYPNGLFYDTYDVTSLVTAGDNAVGLWLGLGYNQSYSKWGYRWNLAPTALLQLEIVYADGSKHTVVTDENWKWANSPIVQNDIYNGETYDARRELPNWSRAGVNEQDWAPVAVQPAPAGPLKSSPFPCLVVAKDLHPVKITETKPGVYLFDLGQNFAGWVQLKTSGQRNAPIVIRHAEDIHPDGSLDTKTNRLAHATDTFIPNSDAPFVYEPRFTYHGFRYVEVTGLTQPPTADTITGRFVTAALDDAGSFHTSDPFLNRLHETFRWSIASNLYGIPTDTPTRDERTPCQMDSLAVEDAAIANFAIGPYYAKWLNDIAGDGGSLPSWTGDQVILPYLLWQNYGDRRILEQHFDNMKRVVDRFTKIASEKEHPWESGFGDWAPPSSDSSYLSSFSEGELVGRAFHYRCARILAEVAAVLDHADDAVRYRTIAQQIHAAFNQRFFNPRTATYSSGRQVTSILPLAFGLVPDEHRHAVVDSLRQRILTQDHGHLDTGIFGTRYLFEVLIDAGYADLAYQILTVKDYPGYADQMAMGATTTWEQWAFAGSMQTHNHSMFSGPDDTFFSRFGGIQATEPGFRKIRIRPAMPAGLDFVECSRDTTAGKITTHWLRHNERLVLRVTIPVNTTADIHLPSAAIESITESDQPVRTARGVLSVASKENETVVTVASGSYEFTIPRS